MLTRAQRWMRAYNELMEARARMARAAAELRRLKAEREAND